MLSTMNRDAIRITTIVLALLVSPLVRGGVWAAFIESATAEHGEQGRRAAEFLAEHRPEGDAQIDLDLLEQNLRFALKARREFAWARGLTEARFFNDVLPYAVLDETRESWRPDFYERCREIVADCSTATEAAQALNREFFNQINVHYNTGRKKPNQSPAESVAQGRATCTGLSIILVDACRAVGVPARIAGVANWADKRGNHTWVEIWDDGWHFTGADEYNEAGLNRAWFVGDAAKAIAGHPEHAVWATSWKATGSHYPMAWNPDDRSVHAEDVTTRYAGNRAERRPAVQDERPVFIRVWRTRGGERIACRVESVDRAGDRFDSATTRDGRADLNDMPTLRIPQGSVLLRVKNLNNNLVSTARLGKSLGSGETIDLYWDELAMSEQDAEGLLGVLAEGLAAEARPGLERELDAGEIRWSDHTLKILDKTFGDEPKDGHSLWISMHGGGGAPTEINDKQWRNQIKLYEPEEGIYVAPRAPTDTWNLWHQGHIDPLFDRLIAAYVIERGVNPDRVYLMGYSAGGDGVFQLAPRMADRFAAAAMMAGHPNETKPLGLRNLPFALLMGGEDAAFDRNKVAARWRDELAALQESDPHGYPHRVTIYPGLGHWMQGKDAEILPWMAQHERVAWPRRVVWHQDDVTHTRFYWLAVEKAKQRTTIEAEVEGQTVSIRTDDVNSVTLRLRDELIDLELPVKVLVNGRQVFEGVVPRTVAAIRRSLDERHDPAAAATALLELEW